MYCSICGSGVPTGATRCDSCGASIRTRPVERGLPAGAGPRSVYDVRFVGSCGRCGYRGEGMPYFSRGSNVAALIGVSIITAGAMGMGGVLYYFLRRDYLICPHCRASWGDQGERARARAAAAGSVASQTPDSLSARDPSFKRPLSIFCFVLAAILTMAGIGATALPPILLAGVAAGAGLLLQRSTDMDRQKRRAALLASLQPQVLQLAARHGAQLTVTQISAELGWSLRRSEKVLQSLDDGVRVSSEVTDDGVIVYEFRELAHSLARPQAGEVEI